MDRTRNLGFMLKTLERSYRKRFEALAQERSLTLPQCKALASLARNEGISQIKLAEIAEIEPMTLVRILDRMEADGWIERRPDPVDRRARCLYVTPGANPVLEQIDKVSAQMRTEALQGLSADERNQLMRLLERVQLNMSSQRISEQPAAAAKPVAALARKKAR
ncbi:MarR family winged helix-turn-helix transcriptional regulator [Steroidobacter sp.]|uniref:MarR family winged helix-turn-helix transcriptional regulator n=1 Tax=Steroidobacter sp. TaxID=1978227 RepID=UPI001A5158DD|nr:MarR family transcriptional regulator [Steroidobacter sp.]MBL8268821.1 MarR family transcriptional regulator [Steroidobacter sp.]